MNLRYLKPLAVALFFAAFLKIPAQTAEELYTKADEHYAAIQFPQAKTAIDEALKKYGDNYDVLWRAARVYSGIAETLPEKDQKATVLKVKDFAERTIKANPNGMHGYLWRGIANGKLALFEGVFGAAGLVKAINEDVKKAISLGNGSAAQIATAHYVLGRLHLKLSEKPKLVRMPLGLGFGNIDDAISHLKKSTELYNGYIMFHLDYARALIEEDKYAEARAQLQKIPAMKLLAYEDDTRKKEAAALLKEIQN
jgi:tetratricopeptide (TPR) repeat protein